MVLEQKPFSVKNDKCLEIQTNSEDIEDNKKCLELLKARSTLRLYSPDASSQSISITVTPGTVAGQNLANGVNNAGAPQNAGLAINAGTAFNTGFQRYPVTLTTPLTGIPSNKIMIEPVSATGNASATVLNIKPTLTAQAADGSYGLTGYIVSFFAITAAAPANLVVTANKYVADLP